MDHRWSLAGRNSLRHDQDHARAQSRRNGGRLLRQRCGDRRASDRPLLSGVRWTLRVPGRGHAYADEVRNPQPPYGDLAFSGGGDRLGRRDPRRSRDRPRRETQGGTVRLLSVASAHSGFRASVGKDVRKTRARRLRPADHARGTDRRGLVQQRIRPTQSRPTSAPSKWKRTESSAASTSRS